MVTGENSNPLAKSPRARFKVVVVNPLASNRNATRSIGSIGAQARRMLSLLDRVESHEDRETFLKEIERVANDAKPNDLTAVQALFSKVLTLDAFACARDRLLAMNSEDK